MTTPNENLGIIGADFDLPHSDAQFALGECTKGNDGSEWIYVQANGAITGVGYVCLIDEDFQAEELNTTNSGSGFGQHVGVAAAAFADNEYGWLQVRGTSEIRVAASAAANTSLNSTGTDGQLDDDGTTGAETIDGLVLTTANGGSAGNAEGILNNPSVGATL